MSDQEREALEAIENVLSSPNAFATRGDLVTVIDSALRLVRAALAAREEPSGCTPCTDCGGDYFAISGAWRIEDALWQLVAGTDPTVVLCPSCFARRAAIALVAAREEPQAVCECDHDESYMSRTGVECCTLCDRPVAAREEPRTELIRQAERVDEVYGKRSQMEIYRLHPPSDETEGFACWSGDVVLDPGAPDLLCVSYAQFSEALNVLRDCAGGSQAADDFVFRMDVNHVRSAAREDTERPDDMPRTAREMMDRIQPGGDKNEPD